MITHDNQTLGAEQIKIVKATATAEYSGDLQKAAVHHIYGPGVIAAGGGDIPSGHDMTLIDAAVKQIKAAGKKPAAKAKTAKHTKAPVRKAPQRKKCKKPAAKHTKAPVRKASQRKK